MKRYIVVFVLIICMLASLAVSMNAAIRKKPVAKKTVAKKTLSTHHETTGTEQLKGEYGLIGHTYTLGKTNPWNISLKSAEYSVGIVRRGDQAICPNREQKLLLLHLMVHNPQKSLALMRFDTIHITAVDANDKNWESAGSLNNESTSENVSQQFKPAQKMDIYTVVVVPANGEIPKLILTAGDKTVIRYDMRGQVKPLPEPIADPNDKTGATALANVQARLGDFYPASMYNVSVEKLGISDGPIDGKSAGPGGRFIVANINVKYLDTFGSVLRFDTFMITGLDTDGLPIRGGNDLLAPSSDNHVSIHIDPGQEVKFRAYVKVNKGVTPKSLVITGNNNGRSFTYNIE